MKSSKPLILTLLFCFIFPLIAFADTFEEAELAIEKGEFKKAHELLAPLADNGNLDAKTLINSITFDEAVLEIAKNNFEKAHELLAPLADNGNLDAKTLIGSMYFKGQGVEKDVNKGLSIIMSAAAKGSEQARALAAAMNKELAALGDVKAMYNIGYMCLNNWGGPVNPYTCLKWLENAADEGHKKSAKVLVQIYKEGKFGVTPDNVKASEWSEKAR